MEIRFKLQVETVLAGILHGVSLRVIADRSWMCLLWRDTMSVSVTRNNFAGTPCNPIIVSNSSRSIACVVSAFLLCKAGNKFNPGKF